MPDPTSSAVTLYSIQQTSVFARLGFQNGDAIERVNGIPLNSYDRVIQAHARLRGARSARIDIRRRGAPVQLVYEIVD